MRDSPLYFLWRHNVAKNTLRLAVIFGANMASRRKEKGITQAELAERWNISNESLSRMEGGKISPRFSRLESLATILNCSVADFFSVPDELKRACSENMDDISTKTEVDPRSKILEHAERIVYLTKMMGETPYKDKK